MFGPQQARRTGANGAEVGEFDPMAHPVLKAMSPRELADIPFPRPPARRPAQPQCHVSREDDVGACRPHVR